MATTATRPARSNTAPPAKRDWLAEITTEAKARPISMVLYAPPGTGKTSFGAAVPDAVFLIDSQEDGIHTLKASGLVNPKVPVLPAAQSWVDVLSILESLKSGKHDYKALIIDTLGGLERLCHEHVCIRDFAGDWGDKGFTSYQKGYEVALSDWRQLLNSLDDLRVQRGMRIICLAHSQVKPFKNPTAEDYDRFVPDLHHKTWNLTHKWADLVAFANYYVVVDKHGKGKGGQERMMYLEYHAGYEAKNRHGLPPEIEMGHSGQEAWKNLATAIQQARKG